MLGCVVGEDKKLATHPVEPWLAFAFPVHVLPPQVRFRNGAYLRYPHAQMHEVQEPAN